MAKPHTGGHNGGRKPRAIENAMEAAKAVKDGRKLVTPFEMLDTLGEEEMWKWLVVEAKKKKELRTVMCALIYWRDRAEGKPSQAHTISGPGGRAVRIAWELRDGTKRDKRSRADGGSSTTRPTS